MADASSSAIQIIVLRALENKLISEPPRRVVVVTMLDDEFTVDLRRFPTVCLEPMWQAPVQVRDFSNVPEIVRRLSRKADLHSEVLVLDEPARECPPYAWLTWRDVVILRKLEPMERSSFAQSYNCP